MDWLDLKRFDLTVDTGVVRVYLQKSDIWRHIKYNPSTRENDLALVFLPWPAAIDPVKLNDDAGIPTTAGDPLDVTSWGRSSGDGYFLNRPHTTTLGYLPNDDCSRPGVDVTDDMMCATSTTEEAKGPCTYDSVSKSKCYSIFQLFTSTTLTAPLPFYTFLSQGAPLIKETQHGPVQVGVTSVDICKSLIGLIYAYSQLRNMILI